VRVREPDELQEHELRSPVALIGAAMLGLCHHVGGQILVATRSSRLLLRLRIDLVETLRHLERFALGSLPLVFAGSILVGGVVSMQGLGYVARYNATEVYGWAVGISSFREVAPLLLALTLASRLGAKNTAELASMVARERTDALTALGLDIERVVGAPRFFAILLSATLLYPIATVTVLLSSFSLAWALGDQRWSASVYSLVEYMAWTVPLEGLLRLTAFGALIGVSSCWFGLTSGRDARGIGRAVYAQSVASVAGIVVLNLYLGLVGSVG
jgi:phospholipid/cholesterol/gamma-HCH transport system permease protein